MASIRRIIMEGRRLEWGGLPLGIEWSPGEIRHGTDRDGNPWEREMSASYGYIRGTRGMAMDGDAIDVYLAPEPVDSDVIYKVLQTTRDGEPDEEKMMLGYESKAAARESFLAHMPEWAFGDIMAVRVGDLRDSLQR